MLIFLCPGQNPFDIWEPKKVFKNLNFEFSFWWLFLKERVNFSILCDFWKQSLDVAKLF